LNVPKYIARPEYLKRLAPFIGKGVIKVLAGQRRVGKSYLLYQLMDHIRKHTPGTVRIYVNKEQTRFAGIRTGGDLVAHVKALAGRSRRCALFIDEIQDIEGFETALRSLSSEARFDIFCTGSNSRLLSGELATGLAGRFVELRVHGLSYAEFLVFHKLPDEPETLMKYLRFGGLPFLMNVPLEEQVVSDYLSNVQDTVLLRDVVARFQVRNVVFLKRLTEYLADNIGSPVAAKRISDFLKSQRVNLSPNRVLNYLDNLCAAFLVSRVPRAEVQGKRIFEINEKYYFEDLGIRNSLTPFQMKDIGKVLENAIFLHLRISGFEVQVGKMGDKEIDFVATRRGERQYVQVAYLIPDEKTHAREFGNLLAIKDNYPKTVVSMDATAEGSFKGIRHVNVREFLKKLI